MSELVPIRVHVGDAALDVRVAEGTPDSGYLPVVMAHHSSEGPGGGVRVNTRDPLLGLTRLVQVSLRGNNSSPYRGPRDGTLDQSVDDIETVRERLGIERWVYVGVSAGGFLGLWYAVHRPGALAGLAVNGCAAYGQAALEDIVRTPRYAEVSWGQGPDGRYVGLRSPDTRPGAWSQELPGFDVRAALAQVRLPVLVTCGRRDTLIPLRHSQDIAARIPGAELVVLEQSGHGVGAPDAQAYRSAVESLLQRVAAQPS